MTGGVFELTLTFTVRSISAMQKRYQILTTYRPLIVPKIE